ncbi:hypothetical protein ACFXTH_007812 [Malus domestica]
MLGDKVADNHYENWIVLKKTMHPLQWHSSHKGYLFRDSWIPRMVPRTAKQIKRKTGKCPAQPKRTDMDPGLAAMVACCDGSQIPKPNPDRSEAQSVVVAAYYGHELTYDILNRS